VPATETLVPHARQRSSAARQGDQRRPQWSSLPLFWRVFVTNAVVLALAFAGLAAAPIRVSVPVATGEFVVLGAGLVALPGHGTEEVRRIARRLRPETLEDLGLQSALAALATAVGDQARIVVRRHLEPTPGLAAEHELVVYRVAQEALTNVARHAAAGTVELVLAHSDRHTVLTVADDGRGLGPGSLPSAHGIRGMRERATLIGAGLTICPRAGGGTQVQLVVPHPIASST
jgi:signal transduction histidine kinase